MLTVVTTVVSTVVSRVVSKRVVSAGVDKTVVLILKRVGVFTVLSKLRILDILDIFRNKDTFSGNKDTFPGIKNTGLS